MRWAQANIVEVLKWWIGKVSGARQTRKRQYLEPVMAQVQSVESLEASEFKARAG